MEQDPLFERLRSGTAPMEEWTQAVSHGAITPVADTIVTVHSTYFCGSVTALRTAASLVLIDTANAALAAQTLAAHGLSDDIHEAISHCDDPGKRCRRFDRVMQRALTPPMGPRSATPATCEPICSTRR